MGTWNTHGMSKDNDLVTDAADALGFFPGEIEALADYAQREAWVWEQMAKHESGQKKRKANLISKFWKKRGLRWKELAAEVEQTMSEDLGEEQLVIS